ncbi:MAG: hypothetical protein DYH03_03965 [Nitrospira sp. NTP1]|nr:hypothetical protein [Nitrospira sp. NTP1]
MALFVRSAAVRAFLTGRETWHRGGAFYVVKAGAVHSLFAVDQRQASFTGTVQFLVVFKRTVGGENFETGCEFQQSRDQLAGRKRDGAYR